MSSGQSNFAHSDAEPDADTAAISRDRTDPMLLRAHGTRKYPNSKLLASTAGRGWSTLSVELRSHPAGRIVAAPQQTVEIAIGIRGGDEAFIVREADGRSQQAQWSEGSIWLAPVGIDEADVVATAAIPMALHLYLPIRQFNVVADEYNFACSPVHSLQRLGALSDGLIHQIGLALLSEMKEETSAGRMFAETASLMLAARIAQRYSEANFDKFGPATPHNLDNGRLRRILHYIEEHLEQEITVEELAAVANLSPFHFSRMFTATIGVPPYRYICRRRLDEAMSMLSVGRVSLAEIAQRSRFSSQASFTRAFRRVTGMTPGEYRRHIR